MKMCSAFRLIVMQMRLIFMIGFARGLVLKQRLKQTRNSPIAVVLNVVQVCTFYGAWILAFFPQWSGDLSEPRYALFL